MAGSTFRGETEYGVKVLPFGGFVKITGMTSVEEIDVADEPRSFRNQPGWQRIIVLAAGSFMHFVLALFLLHVVAAGIGLETASSTTAVGAVETCVPLRSANPSLGPSSTGRMPACGRHSAAGRTSPCERMFPMVKLAHQRRCLNAEDRIRLSGTFFCSHPNECTPVGYAFEGFQVMHKDRLLRR